MAYHSKYSGAEVDALLDKIKDDNVGSIDSSLSTTSENPVQNKVITGELNKKANKADIATINGQTLTNGGNIEVITDAYDDTEIKGKLTELDSQIEGEAAARAEADAALQTQINGKQEALTLTVKDNGNIVLANIQGQSKEFMPATPSGDPMHWAYVTAGAEYNDTGADIVKTTPWADLVDDDYTGEYGKTVVHKAGYWYLNGLGDITNEQLRAIYNYTSNFPSSNQAIGSLSYLAIRTNFERVNGFYSFEAIIKATFYAFRAEVIKHNSYNATYSYAFNSTGAKVIMGIIDTPKDNSIFNNCQYLEIVYIKNLKVNLSFATSTKLSIKSVLYMIKNEAATSPITITLHKTVYDRCMANDAIKAALQTHTNVSLASA